MQLIIIEQRLGVMKRYILRGYIARRTLQTISTKSAIGYIIKPCASFQALK